MTLKPSPSKEPPKKNKTAVGTDSEEPPAYKICYLATLIFIMFIVAIAIMLWRIP